MKNNRRAFLAGLAGLASLHVTLPAVSASVATGDQVSVLSAFGKVRCQGLHAAQARVMSKAVGDGIWIVSSHADAPRALGAEDELQLSVEALPEILQGVQLLRYGPWNAWIRPLTADRSQDLKPDDVQLFYWRDRDDVYGVVVPLSGAGLRTTIGQVGGRLTARAHAGAAMQAPATMPMLTIGYGRDPYQTIAATYRAALAAMDRRDSEGARKRLPEALTYLGWNSWNASELGKNLTEDLLLGAATELRAAGVPLGWMMVDDGYFDQREQRLRGFDLDPAKFPHGFARTLARLKSEHGIKYVGAWMALNGYWHGIDPAGPLGKQYAADLFSWRERDDRADGTSTERVNAFLRPDRPAMAQYYDAHIAALKAHGFDFLKVDNQLVVERMAKGHFPIWQFATAMHGGLNAAVSKHFNDAVINCMDLTTDAYFNFGTTPVARSVEDYFPYKPGEAYDLEKGNAAAHVMQATYNALYVSQVAVPDFDMFESTNPNALVHAVARVANNGPIYITDQPGRHDIALIRSMALEDGRTLRADTALQPCRDCMFQLQQHKPFKAFSKVGTAALLAVFNLADADQVGGQLRVDDVPDFAGHDLVGYDHVGKRMQVIGARDAVPVQLPRFGVQLWSLHVPLAGCAAFGRRDKLNGAAVLRAQRQRADVVQVELAELGPFAGYAATRPRAVRVDGREVAFDWREGLLQVDLPVEGRPGMLEFVRHE